MKIIEYGLQETERIWIGKCRVCLSRIEANQSELTNITFDYKEGLYFSWESCPVCNSPSAVLFYPTDSLIG
jgi:hypothetical protein